jgi:hypothetical protein
MRRATAPQSDDDIIASAEQSKAKLDAAVYREKGEQKILRGHNAVDPSGHLVMLAGDTDLPTKEWRWATADDIAKAESAAAAAIERDKVEAERKARESAHRAAKPARAKGGPLKK